MPPLRTQVSVALLGFGNVGRAFVRYAQSGAAPSKTAIIVRAVADSSGGLFLDNDSSVERVIAHKEPGRSLQEFAPGELIGDPQEFIRALRSAGVSVLVESLPTNIADGQPALRLITAALEQGTSVVTVDKGPLVHGFEALKDAARKGGARLGFSG